MSRDSRDGAILAAHERLVDALAADLLDASDDEVLASHTPAAARVAADTLRRRLHRDPPGASAAAGPPEPSRRVGRDLPHRPDRKQ